MDAILREHAMIDIECLGTEPGSVITQIGAVAFNIAGSGKESISEKTFLRNIDIDSCLRAGLVVDGGATEFWLKQDHQTRSQLFFPPPVQINVALTDLRQWCSEEGIVFAWSNGSNFDVVLIDAAWKKVMPRGSRLPWAYKNARDTRTIWWLARHAGWEQRHQRTGVQHSAVDDAMNQAIWVQEAFRYLREGK